MGVGVGLGPQSNQRGIETIPKRSTEPNQIGPQSNQRGIETFEKARNRSVVVKGLNRTSVGLKQAGHNRGEKSGRCLNRTSVGLKQFPPHPR